MADEFDTTPGKLIIDGNIIGETLGTLSDVSGFNDARNSYKCAVTSDTQITVNGITFNVAKMVYSP